MKGPNMTAWKSVETLKRRPYVVLILCLTVFALLIFALDKCVSKFHHRLPEAIKRLPSFKDRKNTSPKEPLVYVYNNFFRSKDWYSFWTKVNGSESLRTVKRCPTTCRFTWNQSYLKSADFVLVSIAGYHLYGGKAVKLNYAKREQIWVAFLHEPPTYRKGYEAVDGIFNWVATHRQDSDIFVPSGQFFPINSSQPRTGLEDIRASLKKKKLAAWLVSHCETFSEREILVQSLQRHIPVDIFGECSHRNCTETKGVRCRQYLGRRYKFYLAFENSMCLDYVTEKFYYPYENNMVPVAFGWANYSHYGPPGSYINALDFDSVKDLADYLLYLDGNDDEYMKYFAWKESYRVKLLYLNDMTCILCKAMSDHMNNKKQMNVTGMKYQRAKKKKTYKSVKKWHVSLPARQSFHIGKRLRLNVSKSCFQPSDHPLFTKWIRGGNM